MHLRAGKLASIVIALLLCASCGPTKYTKNAHAWPNIYGYDELPVDSSTYRVTFEGNSSTNPELVDRYALYRAAELTVEKGFDYFVVIDGQSNSVMHQGSTFAGVPSNTTTIEHHIDPTTGQIVPVAVTTSTTPVYSSPTTTEHSITKTIRMFKGRRPENEASAYDAHSMVNVMAPAISR